MKAITDRIDDIELHFSQADEDADGRISLSEFRGLMLALDRCLRDDAVTTTFLALDADRDGRISFPEFRSWWLRD